MSAIASHAQHTLLLNTTPATSDAAPTTETATLLCDNERAAALQFEGFFIERAVFVDVNDVECVLVALTHSSQQQFQLRLLEVHSLQRVLIVDSPNRITALSAFDDNETIAALIPDAQSAAFVGLANGDILLLELSLNGDVSRQLIASDEAPSATTVRCAEFGVRSAARGSFPVDSLPEDALAVTAIQHFNSVSTVAVGFQFGALVLVELLSGTVVFAEIASGVASDIPATHFAFQALPDDSRAYVWMASCESTLTETGTQEDGTACLSMYELTLQNSSLQNVKGFALRHQRTLTSAGRVLFMASTRAGRHLSQQHAVFVWNDQNKQTMNVELFDLENMLHYNVEEDDALFVRIGSERFRDGAVPVVACVPPSTIEPMTRAVPVLRTPDDIGGVERRIDVVSLRVVAQLADESLLHIECTSDAHKVVSQLSLASASALLNPTPLYEQFCQAGLLQPDDGILTSGQSSQTSQQLNSTRRTQLLTLALEYGESGFICRSVLERRGGGQSTLDADTILHSRYELGNPVFVLDWLARALARIERRAALSLGLRAPAAPANDTVDDKWLVASEERREEWRAAAFAALADLHDVLGALLARDDGQLGATDDGVRRLESLRERTRVVAQQLELAVWMCDAGLLDSGRNDVADRRALAPLHRQTAERRVQRNERSSSNHRDEALLIDVLYNDLAVPGETMDNAPTYPPDGLKGLLKLFSSAYGESNAIVAKQRIALYFLIDAEMSGTLTATPNKISSRPLGEQYARYFGIEIDTQRLVHGAWLLDCGLWEDAIPYFCQQAPRGDLGAAARRAIADYAPPFTSLLMTRASAGAFYEEENFEEDLELEEERAQRVAVLLRAGAFAEALGVIRGARSDVQRKQLQNLLFAHYAKNGANPLLHAPLHPDEDAAWARFAHAAATERGDTAPLELLVTYSLARGRVADAAAAVAALQQAARDHPPLDGLSAQRVAARNALRQSLLDNFLMTIPKTQREVLRENLTSVDTDSVALLTAQPASAARAHPAQQSNSMQTDDNDVSVVSTPTKTPLASRAVQTRMLAPPSARKTPRKEADVPSVGETLATSSAQRSSVVRATPTREQRVDVSKLLDSAPRVPSSAPTGEAAQQSPPLLSRAAIAVRAVGSPRTTVVPGSPAAKKSRRRHGGVAMRSRLANDAMALEDESGIARTPIALKTRSHDAGATFHTPRNTAFTADSANNSRRAADSGEDSETSPLPPSLREATHQSEMAAYFNQFTAPKAGSLMSPMSMTLQTPVRTKAAADVRQTPPNQGYGAAAFQTPRTPVDRRLMAVEESGQESTTPSSPIVVTQRRYNLRRRTRK